MNDSDFNKIIDPDKRRAAVQAYLQSRGYSSDRRTHILTPEANLSREALGIFDAVLKNYARPMLRALKQPSDYSPAGTQLLFKEAFTARFSKLSKDELVMLVSIMHAEELEKQTAQMANAGLVGEDMDKQI